MQTEENRELSQAEVKELLYQILRSFADYCDAHGIRYRLCGGTLLGAVRHRDFIPWDDDIDVFLPRPDYEKLGLLVKNNPVSSHLRLVRWEDGTFMAAHARLLDVRTRIASRYQNFGEYLWIDIFPVDGLPEEASASDELLTRALKLRKMYQFSTAKIGKGRNWYRTAAKIPVTLLTRLRGAKYYSRHLEKLAHTYSYENCTYVGAVASSCGPCERLTKKEFEESTEVYFHSSSFHAPACWDSYLHAMYGDYRKLPPEEKRTNHAMKVFLTEIRK